MVDLNLGCGDYYADGWVNVDTADHPGVHRDVGWDVLEGIPHGDGTVNRVYMGHVLEHLPLESVVPFLTEVFRVLAPTGAAVIIGPDIGLTYREGRSFMKTVVYGATRWPGDTHLWNSTGEAHLFAARLAGFDAELVPIGSISEDWPVVDRDTWQFAVTLAKP